MELEKYKQQIKELLEQLINSGDIDQANLIINEYENIISNDPDIVSMKAILHMSYGDVEEAEELLWSAIRGENINSDIFYNLAYLYQKKGDNTKAYTFYKKAYAITSDSLLKEEIQVILDNINKYDTPYNYRFSIVIPTRNSANTLEFTLQTCLSQDFDNYEIVVSDNSSENNRLTEELIEKINDKNIIKYYKPNKELSMTENFEFAVSKATGEYIIVLGSDDALLFHALVSIDNIINKIGTKLLHWPLVAYGWPNVSLNGYENFFGTTLNSVKNINYSEIDSYEIIKNVIGFKTHYSALPTLYCNTAVHRDLLNKLKNKTGSIFKSYIPDVYSGFALAYIKNSFTSINLPMSIGGTSSNSNGIAWENDSVENRNIKKDFIKLNNEAGITWSKIVPKVRSLEACIAESFIVAKHALFVNNKEFNIDRKLLTKKCLEGLNMRDSTFYDEFNMIYDSLRDNEQLKEWFEKNYINGDYSFCGNKNTTYNYSIGYNGGVLRVDASNFNVKNVYDAAVLYRNLTGS